MSEKLTSAQELLRIQCSVTRGGNPEPDPGQVLKRGSQSPGPAITGPGAVPVSQPNASISTGAGGAYLPQVFALLTAAESQSRVNASRSVGSLGRRLPAKGGLDGVKFGPSAAQLRALGQQQGRQQDQAAARILAPQPRRHRLAGGPQREIPRSGRRGGQALHPRLS